MSAKTVFVSYRRDAAGKAFARSLKQELTHRGYDAFLDVDGVDAGKWAQQILTEVPQRAHFLLVLTPGALDRCVAAEDWVRREFELAVKHMRNIVPIREESVDLAKLRKRCPDCMKGLFDLQIVTIRHGSFDGDIAALVERHIPPHKAPKPTPPTAIQTLHQLPPAVADFTGRDDELNELRQAAARGAVIAGLKGAGGIGKTALALVLAYEWKGRFRDAQIFLNLRGSDPQPLSPEKAMEQIIHSFIPDAKLPDDRDSILRIYHSVLDGKKVLLLLDNARDAHQVAPLLPPASCGVIITSRWSFALPGMKTKDLGLLSPEQATELLLTICDRIGNHAAAIAEKCGCLPFALRLAGESLATRPSLKPEKYLQRLGEAQLKELDGVAASLRVSYELLAAEQAPRWRQLGVFSASFGQPAAAAIWGVDENAAAESLERFHSASMVEWNQAADRYRLHDLAREFAWQQLTSAEGDAALLRYAQHYCDVGAEADRLYLQGGENVLRGLQLFDRERAHLEAAFGWLRARPDKESAALLVSLVNAVVYTGQELRFHPRERIQWLQAQHGAARISKHRQAEGAAIGNLGLTYANLGELRKAIEFHKQALVIDREIGDRRGEGNALGSLGLAYANLGEPRKAIEFYEQRLVIAREIGDRRGEGSALGNLGNAYANLGELRKAIEFYEQRLVIAREIGDRRGEGNALGNLGVAYKNLGEPRKAIEFYEQALVIAREIGDRRGEGNAFGNLGSAYLLLGEPRKAIEFYEQRLVIALEIGDRRGEGSARFNSAQALGKLGERVQAIERAEAALRIFEAIEDPAVAKVRTQLAQWRGK